MRNFIIIIFVSALLISCSASIGVVGLWHFGDGSSTYGVVSIHNDLGYATFFYIGHQSYGPISDSETIVIQLKEGSYWIRDFYGHSRYINVNSRKTVFVIFS